MSAMKSIDMLAGTTATSSSRTQSEPHDQSDPNDPKLLVSADSVTDEDGGSLARYGFTGV